MPQVRERTERSPWSRMMERAEEPEDTTRPAIGASIRVRGADDVKKKVLRSIEAGPNAPLLMRIVRHPFELAPVRFGKVRHREEVAERLRTEPREQPLAYREELREAYSSVNPFMVYAHRPEHRPPPFLRARLAMEGGDE